LLTVNRRLALQQLSAVLGAVLCSRWPRLAIPDHDVRSYGARGDGRTDDTEAFHAAMTAAATSGGRVLVPTSARPYMGRMISLQSGVRLHFEPGAVLMAPRGLGRHEVVLRIHGVRNVEVEGGIIDGQGDRQGRGEWRHGVSIRGASGITVRRTTARNCAGDGFYIGSTAAQPFSADVVLEDCHADGNRRQGISLISGRNVVLIRPRLTHTAGTAPQAGLDLEPNDPEEFMEGIRVLEPYTAGNAGGGILLALHRLSERAAAVDIEIQGHTSVEDRIGFRTTLMPNRVRGHVRVTAPRYVRPGLHGFLARNWGAHGPRLDLIRPLVVDPNEAASRSARFASAIALYETADDTEVPRVIGNVHIEEPEVRDTRSRPRVSYGLYLRNEVDESAMAHVSVVNPLPFTGVAVGREAWIAGNARIVDPDDVLRRGQR
jgi:hypothetical protein